MSFKKKRFFKKKRNDTFTIFDSGMDDIFNNILRMKAIDLCNKGNDLCKQKRYNEAIRCFDKALMIDPNNKIAWTGKENARRNLKKKEEITNLCSKGTGLFKQGMFKEAIECFDRALKMDPRNTIAWIGKGGALIILEKYEEAIECFDRALKMDPSNINVWFKGIALYGLEKHEEAIECFDRALKMDPSNINVWIYKGRALDNLGKHEEAIKCYDEALEIGSKDEMAWEYKGKALYKLKKYIEAIECFDKVLEIDSSKINAWICKGKALDNLGKHEEAIECFDKVLEIDSKDERAWENKGKALYKLKKYIEAIECLDKSLSIEDDPEVRKLKEEIEAKLEKPKLKIEFIKTSFILNIWEKIEMDVVNEGDAIAKNIILEFSEDITIRGLPEIEVKPKSRKRVEFYLKPNVLGEVPVEVKIKCNDNLNKNHEFKQIVVIEVKKE